MTFLCLSDTFVFEVNYKAITRAILRKQRRMLGWRGNKSKNKQKDGFNRQLYVYMKYFGDYAHGKSMENIKEGLEEFFLSVSEDFTPEVFEAFKSRTILDIEKKDAVNLKAVQNPIVTSEKSSIFSKIINFIKKIYEKSKPNGIKEIRKPDPKYQGDCLP